MVTNNIVSEVGDTLSIKTQLAVRGDISLTGFTDEVFGETASRYFLRRFRYSKDNLKWSDWTELTNENVQKISGSVFGLLFFEMKYIREGADQTGILEFNAIEFQGNIELQICINTATVDSIFASLADNDSITNEIANNLLRKIYFHGILPTYIPRGEGVDDEDFISLWGAVCFFMSLLISFGNSFDEILYRSDYLSENLKQKGLKTSPNETLLTDLQYLAKNFKNEIRKRGTVNIFKEKSGADSVRGEWLRLICKNYYDEFLVEIMERKHMGYNVGNSAPLYNGTNYSTQLNKTEENTPDFVDLTKYNTFGTVSIVSGGLLMDGASGLGYSLGTPPNQVDIDDLITIDPEIDYEITFKVKQDTDPSAYRFNFGVLGFNKNGVHKPLSFARINDGMIDNTFLSLADIKTMAKISGEYYFVRGIIYSNKSAQISNTDARLNINKGVNLKFNSEVEKIKICIYGSGTGSATIHDLKMRPMIRGKNILKTLKGEEPYVKNPQFVQQGNTVMCWMKNNGEEMTDFEVHNFVERYLLPYQQKLTSIFLSPKVDDKQLLT